MRFGLVASAPDSIVRSDNGDFDETAYLRDYFRNWYRTRSKEGPIPVREVEEMQSFLAEMNDDSWSDGDR